jgi:IS5 family transposase
LGGEIPDRNTIWNFKEKLKLNGLMKKLFDKFDNYLETNGYAARKGHIVDASIIEVPIQRNSRKENDSIKKNENPESWQPQQNDSTRQINKKLHKKAQKDTDARWTQKSGRNYFGFKNHTRCDVDNKLVRDYKVTSASVHDSQAFDSVLKDIDDEKPIYADSAYKSEQIDKKLRKRGNPNRICRKGYRNHPISKKDKKWNRDYVCRIRARIEHIYGAHKHFGGDFIRSIGMARARVQIGIINLTYNLRRFVYYERTSYG